MDAEGKTSFEITKANEVIEATFVPSKFLPNAEWNVEGQYFEGVTVTNGAGNETSRLYAMGDYSEISTFVKYEDPMYDGKDEFAVYLAYTFENDALARIRLIRNDKGAWSVQNLPGGTSVFGTSWNGQATSLGDDIKAKVESEGVTYKVVRKGTNFEVYVDGTLVRTSNGDTTKISNSTAVKHVDINMNVAANRKVSMPITLGKSVIKVEPTTGGTVTVDKSSCAIGETVKVTVAANTGYLFESLKVDGKIVQISADGTYTFKTTGLKHVVAATFVDDSESLFVANSEWNLSKQHAGIISNTHTATNSNWLATKADSYTAASFKVRDNDIAATGFAATVRFTFTNGEVFVVRLHNTITDQPNQYRVQLMNSDGDTMVTNWPSIGPLLTAEQTAKVQGEGIDFGLVMDGAKLNVYLDGALQGTYDFTKNQAGEASDIANATAKIELRIYGNANYNNVIPFTLGKANINVVSSTGGVVNLDKTSYNVGDTVVVQPVADDEYYLAGLSVNGAEVTELDTDGTYKFIITRDECTIEANFTKSELFDTHTAGNWNWDVSTQHLGYITVPDNGTGDPNWLWTKADSNYTEISAVAKYYANRPATYEEETRKETPYALALRMKFGEVNKTATVRLTNTWDKWQVQLVGGNGEVFAWDTVYDLTDAQIAKLKDEGIELKLVRNSTTLDVYLDGTKVASAIDLAAAGVTASMKAQAAFHLWENIGYDTKVPFTLKGATVVTAPATNGTLSVNKTSVSIGEEVTVTVAPASGYYCDSIRVNGEAIQMGSDKKATFTVKEAVSTVTATFTNSSIFDVDSNTSWNWNLSAQHFGEIAVPATGNSDGNSKWLYTKYDSNYSQASVIAKFYDDGVTSTYGMAIRYKLLTASPVTADVRLTNDGGTWKLQKMSGAFGEWGGLYTLNAYEIKKLSTTGLEYKMVRNGTTFEWYLDGKLVATDTTTITNAGATAETKAQVAFCMWGNVGYETRMPFALGKFAVDNVNAWVDYPASEIDLGLADKSVAKDVVYSGYDTSMISIDAANMKVTALKAGTTTVTATLNGAKTTFKVNCSVVDKTVADYTDQGVDNGRVAACKTKWEENGIDGKTTIFLGDSFMDERGFWTNFSSEYYPGKDAFTAGVSSSTSHDWELYADSFLQYTRPKNIVMHMGTNNIYDLKKDAATTINELQRMFYVMHDRVPDAHIYWFTISYRTRTTYSSVITEVNTAMKKWIANRDWMTCIDTAPTLTTDMLRDGVHPTLEAYSVFTEALATTDIEISNIPGGIGFRAFGTGNVTYDNVTSTVQVVTEGKAPHRTRAFLRNGKTIYTGNYVVSGTVKLENAFSGAAPWTELFVNNVIGDKWYGTGLLPVGNITFGANAQSKTYGFGTTASSKIYEDVTTINTSSKTYDFKVIAYNGTIVFKINDVVKVYNTGDKNTKFAFGAEEAIMTITNFKAIINNDAAVQKECASVSAFSVNNLTAWVDYPESDIDITILNGGKESDVTFSGYDTSVIQIDAANKKVKALKAGTTTVKATLDGHETTFKVTCETVNKTAGAFATSSITGGATAYTNHVNVYKEKWLAEGTNGRSTVVLGDSYFDQVENGRWNNFYTDYAGYDAFCFGFGGSKSQTWETYIDGWVAECNMQPKNIIINIGVNNNQETVTMTKELQRLFYLIHDRMPNTKIYWTSMAVRYDSYVPDYAWSNTQNAATNANMKAWCEHRDWITYIDMSNVGLSDYSGDKLHPTAAAYVNKYMPAFAKADVQILPKGTKAFTGKGVGTTINFNESAGTFSMDASGGRTRAFFTVGGAAYKGDYYISGTMKISNSGWVELLTSNEFADSWYNKNSTLLSNITFGTDGRSETWGFGKNGPSGNVTTIDTSTLTYNFTVISYNGKVIFKINDKVVAYTTSNVMSTFAIGAEGTTVNVSNLQMITHDDAAVKAKFDAINK